MKNKKALIFLPLAAALLASCGTTTSSSTYNLLTISPAGAPAFAYYDAGSDSNFRTDSTPSNVAKELLSTNYDAVVFDSINGLNSIKSKGANFKLARFLTGGNYYVVSYDKEATAVPTAEDSFGSFGQGLLPDLIFNKLKSDYKGWSTWNTASVNYDANGVSDIRASLIAKKFDYYFIAEPALFAAKAALGDDASKVHVVANVREAWKDYSGSDYFPQGALFIRKSTIASQPSAVETYLKALDARLTVTVDDPATAKKAMDQYSTVATEQVARWGFNSNVVYNVQKDGNNGLGMVKPGIIEDNATFVNDFIAKLGSESYTSYDTSLFY